jgi:hypothetical protein
MGIKLTAEQLAAEFGWSVAKARSVMDRRKVPFVISPLDGRRRVDADVVRAIEDAASHAALAAWVGRTPNALEAVLEANEQAVRRWLAARAEHVGQGVEPTSAGPEKRARGRPRKKA